MSCSAIERSSNLQKHTHSASHLQDNFLQDKNMRPDVLNLKLIWVYSSPRIVFGIMYMLFTTYLLKFATDELFIAPAIMGSLIAISRLWDGVSDPLIGYMSDRTTSKLGRRRSWMFFSIIPMAIGLVMVWSPPPFLTGLFLVSWICLLYTSDAADE